MDTAVRSAFRNSLNGGAEEQAHVVAHRIRSGESTWEAEYLRALVSNDGGRLYFGITEQNSLIDAFGGQTPDWDLVRQVCDELTYTDEKTGLKMRPVITGIGLLGSSESDEQSYEDERPQRPIFVRGFWMSESNVTVAHWRRFAEATGRQMPTEDPDHYPITNVSWHDCVAYCEWAGMKLPHEDQWEYAARGIDGRIYPWGNEPPPEGRTKDWQPETHAGPFGHRGLSGQVWQWCSNPYNRDRWAHLAGVADPTLDSSACTGADAGTTTPGTAAPPTGTGAGPRTETTSSASDLSAGDADPTVCAGAAAGTTWPVTGTTWPVTAAPRSATGASPAAGTATSSSARAGDSDPTWTALNEAATGSRSRVGAGQHESGITIHQGAGHPRSASAPRGDSDPTACIGAAVGGTMTVTAALRDAGTVPDRTNETTAAASDQAGDSDPTRLSSDAAAGSTTLMNVAQRVVTTPMQHPTTESASRDSGRFDSVSGPTPGTPAGCAAGDGPSWPLTVTAGIDTRTTGAFTSESSASDLSGDSDPSMAGPVYSEAAAGIPRTSSSAPRSASVTTHTASVRDTASDQRGDSDPPVCAGVAAGATTPDTATPLTAAGTTLATGTAALSSARAGDSDPTACSEAVAGTVGSDSVALLTAASSVSDNATAPSASAQHGDSDPSMAPTTCIGVVAGTTMPGSAAPRTASGSAPATGTTTSASAPPGDSDPTSYSTEEPGTDSSSLQSFEHHEEDGTTKLSATNSSVFARGGDSDPTLAPPGMCTGAAAGTTSPGTAAPPSGSGTSPRTAASASAFAPSESSGDSDPTLVPTAPSARGVGTPRSAGSSPSTDCSDPQTQAPSTSDSDQSVGDSDPTMAPTACIGAAAGSAWPGSAAPRAATAAASGSNSSASVQSEGDADPTSCVAAVAGSVGGSDADQTTAATAIREITASDSASDQSEGDADPTLCYADGSGSCDDHESAPAPMDHRSPPTPASDQSVGDSDPTMACGEECGESGRIVDPLSALTRSLDQTSTVITDSVPSGGDPGPTVCFTGVAGLAGMGTAAPQTTTDSIAPSGLSTSASDRSEGDSDPTMVPIACSAAVAGPTSPTTAAPRFASESDPRTPSPSSASASSGSGGDADPSRPLFGAKGEGLVGTMWTTDSEPQREVSGAASAEPSALDSVRSGGDSDPSPASAWNEAAVGTTATGVVAPRSAEGIVMLGGTAVSASAPSELRGDSDPTVCSAEVAGASRLTTAAPCIAAGSTADDTPVASISASDPSEQRGDSDPTAAQYARIEAVAGDAGLGTAGTPTALDTSQSVPGISSDSDPSELSGDSYPFAQLEADIAALNYVMGVALSTVTATSDSAPSGDDGSIRVDRGGSWCYDASFCRYAIRDWVVPAVRSSSLGFRPARSFVSVFR